MTTKEYLSQLNRLETIINQKQAQLDELKQLANSIKSTDYSKEIVDSSKDSNVKFVYDVEKIALLESEINQIIIDYTLKKGFIVNQIHTLSDVNSIEILYKRYIECKSLKDVSIELNYNYDYIRKLHRLSLSDFEKITQNNTTYHNQSMV